jgi:hypothetical protein
MIVIKTLYYDENLSQDAKNYYNYDIVRSFLLMNS